MASQDIQLVVTDVDGTLLTSDKRLTQRTIDSVGALRESNIQLAITSGRPPRGLAMLVEPLGLSAPMSAFNGGVIVRPDLSIITEKRVPGHLVGPIMELVTSHGLDVWIYTQSDWYVSDPTADHVAHEAQAVGFSPTRGQPTDNTTAAVAKIVGVSDDIEDVQAAEQATRAAFGAHVSASRSQPYYLDVTHPDANKGAVVAYLSAMFGVPASGIASLGDMPNDILMFAHSGLSIAMGNADREVQRAARHVTASNDDEGFAKAIEHFVLTR